MMKRPMPSKNVVYIDSNLAFDGPEVQSLRQYGYRVMAGLRKIDDASLNWLKRNKIDFIVFQPDESYDWADMLMGALGPSTANEITPIMDYPYFMGFFGKRKECTDKPNEFETEEDVDAWYKREVSMLGKEVGDAYQELLKHRKSHGYPTSEHEIHLPDWQERQFLLRIEEINNQYRILYEGVVGKEPDPTKIQRIEEFPPMYHLAQRT